MAVYSHQSGPQTKPDLHVHLHFWPKVALRPTSVVSYMYKVGLSNATVVVGRSVLAEGRLNV